MNIELLNFIEESKKKTYASTTSSGKKVKGGGVRYVVKGKGYVYTDIYFGNLVDCGQEIVTRMGKVVWVMSYRGGIVKGNEKMRGKAFTFLKKCISNAPKDFPMRGPKKYFEGDFTYENSWTGEPDEFTGEESIFYKKKKVCFRNYLGGITKFK
jgi:hypothetical protein